MHFEKSIDMRSLVEDLMNKDFNDTTGKINTNYLLLLDFFTDLDEEELIKKMRKNGIKENFIPIRQKFYGKNDGKRSQLTNPNEFIKKELFINELESKIYSILPHQGITTRMDYAIETSVLKSVQRCEVQQYHQDYDDSIAKHNFIAIYAIQDHTTLEILEYDSKNKYRQVTIKIPKFALFFARGDIFHAGSAYKCCNYRYHFYVDNIKYHGHSKKDDISIEVVDDIIMEENRELDNDEITMKIVERETYFISKKKKTIKILLLPQYKFTNSVVKKGLKKAIEKKKNSLKGLIRYSNCSNYQIKQKKRRNKKYSTHKRGRRSKYCNPQLDY